MPGPSLAEGRDSSPNVATLSEPIATPEVVGASAGSSRDGDLGSPPIGTFSSELAATSATSATSVDSSTGATSFAGEGW
eukprot:9827479-Alexandrium_andersonii.AAC.1